MSNTFDKLSVLDSFIEEVNSYLPEIEANLERLAQSPGDMDALEGTYRRTHTIGGAASMMDFPGLAHVAHGMEDILADALDGLVTLDGPAHGLLQRSLGRLHQLLEGVRNGIDEESVIAEDDADYTSYRALIEAASAPVMEERQPTAHEMPTAPFASASPPPFLEQPGVMPSAMPSFDEVLASFRTPVVQPGEDVAWPEDPVSLAPEPVTPFVSPSSEPPFSGGFNENSTIWNAFSSSALDALVASTQRQPEVAPSPAWDLSSFSAPQPVQEDEYELPLVQNAQSEQSYYPNAQNEQSYYPNAQNEQSYYPNTQSEQSYYPNTQSEQSYYPNAQNEQSYYPNAQNEQSYHPNAQSEQSYYSYEEPEYAQQELAELRPSQALVQNLSPLYQDLQRDAQTLDAQLSSLRSVVTQLRDTMSIIEEQRGEFKGFLNGSKDALDRMETWAGQAMGLNLRNSPEQVRRYLPLSVMWVSNSKLKKVLDQLNQITAGVGVNDEQMSSTLQQLQQSIQACGETFQQLQEVPALRQDAGWGPWEMRVARDNESIRERVTFERQGDLAAIRAEIEANVREELRHERNASISRAELEAQIREEVRQEFREQQILQTPPPHTSGVVSQDVLRELEARIRSEVEIQVRQEFLKQIMTNEADGASQHRAVNQTTTNVIDRSHDAIPATPSVVPSQQIPAARTPLPTPSSKKSTAAPSTVTTYSGDIGEEAAEIFRLEAEEHLQTISMRVAALEKDPNNRELIQGIRRATHTLKGAAAMMNFRAIADLCHISEDLLDTIMEGTMLITPAILSIILDTAETLDILITGRGNDPADEMARVRVLQHRYADLLGEQGIALHAIDSDLEVESVEDNDDEEAAPVASVVSGGAEGGTARTAQPDLSVRVRLQRLDELVNLFGELLVNRSVLEERIQRLVRLVADVGVSSDRLGDVGQKLESRFEAATLPSGRSVQVMPGEGNQSMALTSSPNHVALNGKNTPAHFSEFDELELDRYTEFHQLARGLSEGISDMATLSTEMDTIIRECESVFARENRLSTTFQDRLMKARLVPLSTMAPRLYRTGRAVALKQGKDFEFLLEGETTEVDRTVYEEIAGPLLHLIRNAVNHALERPEVRIQRGKNPRGQIKLSAAYEGNQIVITVRDDGTGLNHEKIRQSAIARGLIRADQQLSEGDLVSLIFHPGFSTAESLSEESGRGVGLDVVRDSVSRLRGILAVESSPGHGTAFTMTFPTSLAIQSVMMVKVGGQQFGIPTVHVESIGRLDNFKRSTIGGQPAVVVRNDLYPLHLLAPYLSLPANEVLDDKAQMLLVNAGGYRVALVIDEIIGKSDIVMKNLGPHLREVHGIAGATVLGNGRVVLILELNGLLSERAKSVEIANALSARRDAANVPVNAATVRQRVDVSANRKASAISKPPVQAAATPPRGKHILVVDDSPSVRRVVSSMLKQHGWEVQMARDGVEALEMISAETPAAVLLDIEMPRMDGYELTSTVRAQEQYRTLPLIVLTSRAAAKHQQRAIALGASAYVVKPYQDEELLNTIKALVYGTAR
ncbi:response regulator [Tengunoibacter tsumagoiensis]|uniref:histidine kinase n=1 Tax=Tengunoibacter tsumagoiensis TaxID=2014871 RepID=A0A401ZYE2_9CHLR|nr:response regulator [Tengunoibacter tsumagoiensis]GCE11861.1 hypothetical protein KTT_17200 [Tengunoibacter tsumagoiensis]